MLKPGLNAFAIVLLLAGLIACGKPPACPDVSLPLPPANAGCLVIQERQVLMVRELTGKISLPGGTSERGESAQCTAWRETFEETGLAVQVGARMQVFDNGFSLFRCTTAPGAYGQSQVPGLAGEIREVLWLNESQLGDYAWRFPSQQAMIRAALQQ
ncbi:NUDIX hydrolase [Simiduia agarivorans]|uniref:MutT/nudix family protein n=1 Tax=Simiduia agarivorans (strain DSM 21679 / JCM 13881 / BCRC 17597 / SA1) TaxID=1117647 RepID=K4KX85_SIMAS|nr:NUDIX hydrolase [Simiduia agarivorans]AFU98552.1 MutT/nudix family protein [Simiduia agarivorans SA1 = DSM 21679]